MEGAGDTQKQGTSVAPSCHPPPAEPPPWNSYWVAEAKQTLTCPGNPCAGPSQAEQKMDEEP